MKRRNFLASLAAILPALALSKQSHALTISKTPAESVGIPQGAWNILAHATDGTDPSTAITALPNITPEMRQLAGKKVELSGYLQPLNTGFAKKEYLLSRVPFHCAFCYGGGRASLALIESSQHIKAGDQLIRLSGTLQLQETDPEDYYFVLKNAELLQA